jgi:hypothetical protein
MNISAVILSLFQISMMTSDGDNFNSGNAIYFFLFVNPLLFASCTNTFSKWCKITRGETKLYITHVTTHLFPLRLLSKWVTSNSNFTFCAHSTDIFFS